MMSLNDLLHTPCRTVTGQAMSAAEAQQQIALLPAWSLTENYIERKFIFVDYFETIAFVNALAYVVNREDHHPELKVGFNHCTVQFSTHSVKGLSQNDFICAAKADAIFEQRFGV